MTADPITEPVHKPQDPIDLLIAFEEASDVPIRPEYFEGMAVVPPQPDFHHNDGAMELSHQLRSSGVRLTGIGMGFRTGAKNEKGDETSALAIPDFHILRRRPTELDEAYRRIHKGWYSMELLALVGEIASSSHETDTGPKYRGYAAAGVPVYVLIHRKDGKAYVFSEPDRAADLAEAHYITKTEVELGQKLPLPAPYPPLDTSPLLP